MLWEHWQAVMDQQALSHQAAREIQPVLRSLLASTRWRSVGQHTTEHMHLTDCNSTSHSNVLAAILPKFSNIRRVETFTWSDNAAMHFRKWSLSECKPAEKTAERLYDQHCNAHFWSLLSFLQDSQHCTGCPGGCSLARSVLGCSSWHDHRESYADIFSLLT